MLKKIKIFLIISFLFLPMSVFATVNVTTFDEMVQAISNNEEEINIEDNFEFNAILNITYSVSINGNNHTLTRSDGYTDSLFSVSNTGALTINNLIVDGGASGWKMDIDNAAADGSGFFRADVINDDNDILATRPLIVNSGSLNVTSSSFQNARNNVNSSDYSGGAIRSSGSLLLNNVTFNHCGSYREGGALYLVGGTIVINENKFIDNVAGVGYKARAHGGAIQVNGPQSVTIDKTNFQDNFAQHNGGAIMLQANGSDIKVTNSTFKHNMCGNDGSAVSLESSVNKHKIEITDSVFEENKGIATTGQSMGTLWLDSWKNDDTMPAEFRNLVFKNNQTAHGSSFASYGVNAPYCIMDNIESFGNVANGVGNYFLQSGTYLISNGNIHDNISTNGGAMASLGGNIIVTDTIIKNNTAKQRGGGPMAIFGTLTIKDSEIIGNHSNGYGGGIAAYSLYASYGNPELHLENVLVTGNSADISGGGLSIQDTGTAHSIITADDASKIYANSATVAADDVFYTQANSTSGASITLDNIGIAGIIGIDGWYNDPEDNRFKDTANPTVYEDYVNNDGSVAFYIKAAGIFQADYDGNGGVTGAQPVTIKYGETYVVDDDVPVREGYEFVGWNTEQDGTGTNLNAGDTYDGSEGLVLYATWEEIKYTVNYDLQGGSNDKIVSVTNPYSTPFEVTGEVPEKVGYKFIEWNTKADGSGIKLAADDIYDRSDGFTLYAIYEETKYTVNYDLQGGSNDKIVSVTNPYTTPFKVTSEEPTKEGYKFIEWNTKADGSGIKLAADDIYDRSDGFTLYAIYEEIKEENPIPDVEEKEDVEPPKKEEITTEEEVPKTGDSIVNDIVIAVISFVLLLTSAIVLKKNN